MPFSRSQAALFRVYVFQSHISHYLMLDFGRHRLLGLYLSLDGTILMGQCLAFIIQFISYLQNSTHYNSLDWTLEDTKFSNHTKLSVVLS